MSTYNLNSNMADRLNFDSMVERTLNEAMEAARGEDVGDWEGYFDLDELGITDEDRPEAIARIEAIWP